MFNKIWLYLGIALAAIAGYFGWKAKVRSDAVNEERAKRQQDVVDAFKDRQKSDADIDNLSDDELRERLRPPNRK